MQLCLVHGALVGSLPVKFLTSDLVTQNIICHFYSNPHFSCQAAGLEMVLPPTSHPLALPTKFLLYLYNPKTRQHQVQQVGTGKGCRVLAIGSTDCFQKPKWCHCACNPKGGTGAPVPRQKFMCKVAVFSRPELVRENTCSSGWRSTVLRQELVQLQMATLQFSTTLLEYNIHRIQRHNQNESFLKNL